MASERPPDAFLSYTRFDDRRGAISAFREHLEDAVREVTGEPFEIFQDVDGIGLGERWRGKLDEMLDEARFFIPIVTPSYFKSKACREELEKFLRAEAARGRDDLVLPIYYIQSDVLEEVDLRTTDPLAEILYQRQRQDWRNLRFEAFEARKVRKELERLAREIVRARRRSMLRGLAASTAELATPALSSSEPSIVLRQSTLHVQDSLALRDSVILSHPQMLQPGTIFRDVDAPWCPEMVVIPPGELLMGDEEGPQRAVRFMYGFAVGRYPMTFQKYEYFADATGRAEPADRGWGRGKRPVINVSWEDAKACVKWLASQTGQPYRLLSESEWEYACRARTTTPYWWGNRISPEDANYGGNLGKTTAVGAYPANSWGLHDMHGNVWEWVEDCWNDSYDGAPDDGSAWTSSDCSRRVLRGGSWGYAAGSMRSALREGNLAGYQNSDVGFRVARTLSGHPALGSVEDAHWSELEYHNPALAGRAIFNYANNDGRYSIGEDEFLFETKWSKSSDRSIYLLNDPSSIVGVAEAPELKSYEDLGDPARYDMSSRVRTIQEGEHAILKNRHNKYAVLKVLDIKDRTRSDSVDELTFEFRILTNTI